MKDKLLIFDMDGTLFDTSESNYMAYKEAAESIGYEIDREKFMSVFVGKNYKEFLPLFGIASDEELHKVHEYKKDNYNKCIPYIKKNDRLLSLIEKAREGEDTLIALATTASRKNTQDILSYYNIEDYFDIILAQEDVKKLKPDPECYLKVMEMAGIPAERTTIYEDSEVGLEAARASGASVVKVDDFA